MFQDSNGAAPDYGEAWTARSWDVRLPPPNSSKKGKFVPKRLSEKMRRGRRVAIEDHGGSDGVSPRSAVVKIYVRGKKKLSMSRKGSAVSTRSLSEPDDVSVSDYSGLTEYFETSRLDGVTDGDWKEKYCIPIEGVTATSSIKNVVTVSIEMQEGKKTIRDMVFEDQEQADEFVNALTLRGSKKPGNPNEYVLGSMLGESALGAEEEKVEEKDVLLPEPEIEDVTAEFSAERELADLTNFAVADEVSIKKEPICIQLCTVS
eukprot:CAMPEP_0194266814 /NCGR_PEP_ID=MMETSP0169-20130528/1592_1 /TAXON_ID=218684 /ORGANISM="Corethron pennatum, Strain L29A3" /LENGTH=260 /DNA_ID=CAMNT_0039007581 /DNA_START=17 /DNA_END=799 /DNA_ORIENTATION=+